MPDEDVARDRAPAAGQGSAGGADRGSRADPARRHRRRPALVGLPAGASADGQLPGRADPDPGRGVRQPVPDREHRGAGSPPRTRSWPPRWRRPRRRRSTTPGCTRPPAPRGEWLQAIGDDHPAAAHPADPTPSDRPPAAADRRAQPGDRPRPTWSPSCSRARTGRTCGSRSRSGPAPTRWPGPAGAVRRARCPGGCSPPGAAARRAQPDDWPGWPRSAPASWTSARCWWSRCWVDPGARACCPRPGCAAGPRSPPTTGHGRRVRQPGRGRHRAGRGPRRATAGRDARRARADRRGPARPRHPAAVRRRAVPAGAWPPPSARAGPPTGS